MLHIQLALNPKALDSFPVKALLRATDRTMQTPPVRHLHILQKTLTQMCQLPSSLSALAQAMRVCLTFGFFGMIRQTNLAPASSATFDPACQACQSDVLHSPHGLLLVVRWSTTAQKVGYAPVIPIPSTKGHPAEPVKHILTCSLPHLHLTPISLIFVNIVCLTTHLSVLDTYL